MNVNQYNIEISINDEHFLVNLRWFRGASRYNNGATLYNKKYQLRVVIGRSKDVLKSMKGRKIKYL